MMDGKLVALSGCMGTALQPAPICEALNERYIRVLVQLQLRLYPVRVRHGVLPQLNRLGALAQDAGAVKTSTQVPRAKRKNTPIVVVPQQELVIGVEEGKSLCGLRHIEPLLALGVEALKQVGISLLRSHFFEQSAIDHTS